jgi:hypothetical protein
MSAFPNRCRHCKNDTNSSVAEYAVNAGTVVYRDVEVIKEVEKPVIQEKIVIVKEYITDDSALAEKIADSALAEKIAEIEMLHGQIADNLDTIKSMEELQEELGNELDTEKAEHAKTKRALTLNKKALAREKAKNLE